ncbi:MAG: hypothetical protein B6241_08210 [Spirochaetaceae bacterium 4572_59]|nr:MAG: hypothetical protein B6241_08210 [Spirochaetaceae bacterium 4572_59]
MTININIDSISSLVGSVIALTFAIYYIVSNIVVKKERLSLILSALMFSVFIYLFAYSVYSSSINVKYVLFWTRLCYAGGVSVISLVFLLTSEIIQKESRKLRNFLIFLTIILIIFIYLPTDLFFTKELNPVKTHSSVIKGSFFPFLLLTIYLADLVVLMRFFIGLLKNKDQLYLTAPILLALIFWFCEALFDGILGAVLSIVNMKISLGPIIMTFSLSLFSGRYAELRDLELDRIKKENKEIYKNLIYDNLSTLFSRQYFTEVLEQRVAELSRVDISDCLMFIDVDNFKSVNDELGHCCGDNLITYVGEILRESSRKSDTCARYGGDEFLILLENCQIEDAKKIVESVQKKFSSGLQDILGSWSKREKITLSIGIASSIFWSEDTTEIIQMADKAMYEAKSSGKNNCIIYSDYVG